MEFRRLVGPATVLAVLIGSAGSAVADIVYIGPRTEAARPALTVLTLQENDRGGIESGGVRRVSGGDEQFGDAGATSRTVPFSTISASGVPDAFDLGIFLDIAEPGNDNIVTIAGRNSLILTAYKDDGTVLGQFFYTGEFRELVAIAHAGGGTSDHVFGLDSAQAAALQALILANPDLRLGLTSTLANASGGFERYFFGSLRGH